jgi:hypothetical protein
MCQDPRLPTTAPPGSEAKLAVLEARASLGLPLHVAGDCQGARQLNDVEPSDVTRKSRAERRLIAVLSWSEERTPEALAALAGYKPNQFIETALVLLAEAGLARRGPGGWVLGAET